MTATITKKGDRTMKKRRRPQLTTGEVVDFMSKYPRNTPVFSGPSLVNEDEPEETQEFILEDECTKVVVIEFGSGRCNIGCSTK